MLKFDLKSPAIQKVLLSVILSGAILGGFFFTRYAPFTFPSQRDHLATLKTDYDKKSNELARARATVSDLPRFEAEYEHLHQRWAMAAELLPTDRQMPTLLRKVTLAAQQTGVEFVVFRPEGVKAEQHYTEMPLSISVYGEYHKIGSFVAELANMRRIVTVAKLQLKTHTEAAGSGSTAAEFTASAYSLNAAAASTPPPAANTQQGDAHGPRQPS